MAAVITGRLLDGCSYLLQPSGYLLLFPWGLWMVPVISWRLLDGCCCFPGWLLLFFMEAGWWWATAYPDMHCWITNPTVRSSK